ncbi:hypothetical protein Nepgr_021899 [Nepenthes gracilis]|uniref:Uncharacterized protein n=1 Tax=Nepenthes gracilis TaxID=150966 RepID=A0AAD3SXL7_NEPGR|nr:hypothetical protein Nepgr_021899 [Nepenthes gracilis]
MLISSYSGSVRVSELERDISRRKGAIVQGILPVPNLLPFSAGCSLLHPTFGAGPDGNLVLRVRPSGATLLNSLSFWSLTFALAKALFLEFDSPGPLWPQPEPEFDSGAATHKQFSGVRPGTALATCLVPFEFDWGHSHKMKLSSSLQMLWPHLAFTPLAGRARSAVG